MQANQKSKSKFNRVIPAILMMVTLFITLSCKKTDTSGFTNKLQFGESVNLTTEGWPVVNEKYTYAEGETVNFRLETKDDFGSSAFRLVFTPGGSETYPSLQSYGHIYVSAFSIPTAGSYTVAAYVVNGNKLIDTKSITITP